MEYVHECAFCGWHRRAATPTILSPPCPGCGCMLRSARASAEDPLAAGLAAPFPAGGTSRAAHVVGRLVALVFIVAAAKAGWEAGGAWLALGSLALMGLLTVPLLAPDG